MRGRTAYFLLMGGLLLFLLSVAPSLTAQESTSEPPQPTIELPTQELPPSEPPTAEPPTATFTELPPPPTATNTELPSLTPTNTETPSQTPAATLSETSTFTATSSPTVTSTETFTPTNTALSTSSASPTVNPGLDVQILNGLEPVPPLPIYQSELGSASTSLIGDTFNDPRSYIDSQQSVIAPADADKLALIFQRINSNSLGNPHRVYLLEGTYNITQPLVVRGSLHNITLQGQGANLTILQPAYNFNPYSIFAVTELAELQLRHLTVQNGNAISGGAVAISLQSKLTIYGSRFANNAASGGGAIYGPTLATTRISYVRVDCSIFVNNTSLGRGGAISANQYGSYIIENTSFIDNRVTSTSSSSGVGGAVNSRAINRITNSRLIGNSAAGTTSPISEHVYVDWSTLDASGNWWQNPSVPSIVSSSLNTSNQLAVDPGECVPTPPPPVPFRATPTPTFTPTPSIWYVTCQNLTGPLNVRADYTTSSALLGQVDRGTQAVRPDLLEFFDGNIVRVQIYWPLDQMQTIGYVAIRDTVLDDGDYLTIERDSTCPEPSATPMPSATPTVTATFDPSFPNYSPGRFDDNVPTILSMFGSQPPAVMGICRIHNGVLDPCVEDLSYSTVDIVSKSLEQCIDSSLGNQLIN